ncbi:WD40/YVTN/BNR-like repeat-containing protein [Acanthopleuribacter pedis]|uniref:Sortilin N-terminal domain-containing protein n=1 Tax=Acanthopleuribacter pedis TaxID=442870 RepID=A0A8J7U2T3_9BACT|nr:hypothetical protein [Acanthopleuribacter pedis]MBO1318902.1 hypothetical protein [Acanthopleuribacter pedis]
MMLGSFPRRVLPALVLFAFCSFFFTGLAAEFDPQQLAGLEARHIGPAGMSGRVTAVAAVPDNPRVVYVGTATGGVWKSTNAGLNFEPIFDDQPVHAVGALAIDPQRPETIWVGSGEGNVRNSVSIGNGVYRSQDGGNTWQHMGLKQSERINTIVVDPTDSNVVYVAVLGKLWGESEERGLYKTTDGGKTWKNILYSDPRTGCSDIDIDPRNPNKLFATMWQFQRRPYFFKSGGPGSGLFRSHDGGASWQRIEPEDGLPKGALGRMSVAIAPSDNQRVYVLVEAAQSVFLRSDDGGTTFTTVNSDPNIADRPFYYCRIQVDPKDPNRIYKKETLVNLSTDGGRTWSPLSGAVWPKVHVDHHAIWINPNNPRHLYLGNDGGVAESHDHGQTFRFVANLPLAQFYHIAVDNAEPYNVYGGLQDNGSWRGPSEVRRNGGIRNHFWELVSFGDGFDTVPDPHNPGTGFSMSQGGNLIRWDLVKNRSTMIEPQPVVNGTKMRYNWSAGVAVDPFKPGRIYYGSQFLMQSDDYGHSWKAISEDVTTNKPEWQQQHKSGGLTLDVTAAENYTTITAVRPSPIKEGLLWVGTDDGRLWITRDGGASWKSLEGNIRNLPAHPWTAHIHASNHDPGTAFVVFDNHRRSDFGTYVYRTDNYGARWELIVGDSVSGYALSLIQDPVVPELLYLGTEFGLYISLDAGKSWFKWTFGVPTASVMDLAFQERESDLVIGTHGRGIYILDDVHPLRALVKNKNKETLRLLEPQPTRQYQPQPMKSGVSMGHGDFQGTNEPYGVWFDIFLNDERLPLYDESLEKKRQAEKRRDQREKAKASQGDSLLAKAAKPDKTAAAKDKANDDEKQLEIHIFDGDTRIRRFFADAHQGLNRVIWDLRMDPVSAVPFDPEAPFPSKPRRFQVAPGTYTVKVLYVEETASAQVKIEADSNLEAGEVDWAARAAAMERWTKLNNRAVAVLRNLERLKKDVALVENRLAATWVDDPEPVRQRKTKDHELTAAAKKLREAQTELERGLWVAPGSKGIQPRTHVVAAIQKAASKCFSSWSEPTPAQLRFLDQAEKEFEAWLPQYRAFMDGPVKAFVAEAGKHQLETAFQFKRVK